MTTSDPWNTRAPAPAGAEGWGSVTRVEVIDHRHGGQGRVYVKRDDHMAIEPSLQDNGRTLKIFLMDRKESASPAPSPAAPPAEARDLVERYARAICTARGHGPETLHQVVDPTDYADTSDSHGHRFIYGWRKWVAAAEAVAALPASAKTAEDRQ